MSPSSSYYSLNTSHSTTTGGTAYSRLRGPYQAVLVHSLDTRNATIYRSRPFMSAGTHLLQPGPCWGQLGLSHTTWAREVMGDGYTVIGFSQSGCCSPGVHFVGWFVSQVKERGTGGRRLFLGGAMYFVQSHRRTLGILRLFYRLYRNSHISEPDLTRCCPLLG